MVNINAIKLFLPILFSLILIISSVNIGLNYYQENLKPTGVELLNPKADFSLFAYIAGAVVNPGVYEIKESTKVVDLIAMAGGYSVEVDLEYVNQTLNLSQQVFNEDHIFVPLKKDDLSSEAINSSSGGDIVSINNSTLEQLDTLPGVGEVTANKIIENRPYKTIDELKEVEGIGDKKFEDIKDFISL